MKTKKILASVLAGALAVSAMSVASSAAIIGDSSFKFVDLLPEGAAYEDVYGVTFYLKDGWNLDAGLGGAVGFSTESTGWWTSVEWGNEGSDKPITFDETNGSITCISDVQLITSEQELEGDENGDGFATVQLQQYWGNDIEIDSVALLDKDGNEIAGKNGSSSSGGNMGVVGGEDDIVLPPAITTAAETAAEVTTAAETKADATTAAEVTTAADVVVGDTTTAPAATTSGAAGNTSNNNGEDKNVASGFAFAIIPAAVAAAGVVVAKKRK